MALTVKKRISGNPPRLVGKPLEGDPNTPKGYAAELVKKELQSFLKTIGESANQAQVDINAIADSVNANSAASAIHPFLLMGA